MDKLTQTLKVRQEATRLGFDACGFSLAGQLDKEARRLEEWLNGHNHGTMHWMARHFDKRTDPTRLVPGAKSVISLAASYHFEENQRLDRRSKSPKIAKYARGRDYHKVFKKRLKELFNYIRSITGNVEGRVFVDSAPVMDKVWAEKSGLGWIGKNTNLINRSIGSWLLLGEIIIDVEFVYDAPTTDHCGSCTKCIEACPTDAIHRPYSIDSNRCISYLTIELKESIPQEYHSALGDWVFGCDICQDVCPWNNRARPGRIDDLKPREQVLNRDFSEWEEVGEELYHSLFEGSAVRRASFPKFRESLEIVRHNSGEQDPHQSS